MDIVGFAFAVLVIELTPGPNMAWLATLAATEGRRNGLLAALGTTVGLGLNGVLAAAGLAALLSMNPSLWNALRWTGAAVMLWLAWDAWHTARQLPTHTTSDGRGGRAFATGLGINLLNPKAFIFYVSVAPEFLEGGTLSFGQALILTLVSVTIATIIHILIVLAGARSHAWVSDAARTQTVRRVFAVALVGVAIWFALSTGN